MSGQQTAAELAVGSEFAGYRIEEVAARGGMGVVYRATQLRLTRTVALKLVTPALARDASFRDRFRREWMIAASIDHPNVIPVYEAGESDGALYLAMRWVEGTNMRGLIDSGPLDLGQAVRLVSQVASALDAAHERGLIHRDVKPANILIAEEEHVYLTDFGLTKHASSISGLTRTGTWVGTVDYTAPEQIEGVEVGPATDVYSLGCVMYEALTGKPPHRRDNDLATLWAHMYTKAPSVREAVPDAPAGLDEVLQRALEKKPEDRYASAGEFARAARAAVGDDSVASGVRPPPPREVPAPVAAPKPDSGEPWWRSRRGILAGGVALIAILALVAVFALGGSDDSGGGGSGDETATTQATNARVRAPMPTARQNMDGSVVDGTLWVAGGLARGSAATNKVEGYDPVINSWKAAPNMPVRLHHHMAVTYRGELVVMGGWIPQGSDQSALLSERVFALREGRWTQLPPLLEPRAAGAAAVVGEKIVVFGGQDEGRLLRTTEVFDGEKWTQGANIPTPREHLAAASDGEFAYAVGGRVLGPDQNLAALERYDPESNSWEPLPDMPTPRGGLGATIAGDTLFAVGGESSTRAMGNVEAYDISDQSWASQTPMRTPRHGLVVKAIDGAFYAVGGATRPGHASAVNDLEVSRLTR